MKALADDNFNVTLNNEIAFHMIERVKKRKYYLDLPSFFLFPQNVFGGLFPSRASEVNVLVLIG